MNDPGVNHWYYSVNKGTSDRQGSSRSNPAGTHLGCHQTIPTVFVDNCVFIEPLICRHPLEVVHRDVHIYIHTFLYIYILKFLFRHIKLGLCY